MDTGLLKELLPAPITFAMTATPAHPQLALSAHGRTVVPLVSGLLPTPPLVATWQTAMQAPTVARVGNTLAQKVSTVRMASPMLLSARLVPTMPTLAELNSPFVLIAILGLLARSKAAQLSQLNAALATSAHLRPRRPPRTLFARTTTPSPRLAPLYPQIPPVQAAQTAVLSTRPTTIVMWCPVK